MERFIFVAAFKSAGNERWPAEQRFKESQPAPMNSRFPKADRLGNPNGLLVFDVGFG